MGREGTRHEVLFHDFTRDDGTKHLNLPRWPELFRQLVEARDRLLAVLLTDGHTDAKKQHSYKNHYLVFK